MCFNLNIIRTVIRFRVIILKLKLPVDVCRRDDELVNTDAFDTETRRRQLIKESKIEASILYTTSCALGEKRAPASRTLQSNEPLKVLKPESQQQNTISREKYG